MTSNSRRSFLKKGALAAVALGVGGGRTRLAASPLPRVGIVGGGLFTTAADAGGRVIADHEGRSQAGTHQRRHGSPRFVRSGRGTRHG